MTANLREFARIPSLPQQIRGVTYTLLLPPRKSIDGIQDANSRSLRNDESTRAGQADDDRAAIDLCN